MASSSSPPKQQQQQAVPTFPTQKLHQDQDQEASDPDTYSFRLFAPPAKLTQSTNQTTTTPHHPPPTAPPQIQGISRIKLSYPDTSSPSSSSHLLGKRQRPLSYYHLPAPTPARLAEFAAAALSGAQVRDLSRRPCFACRKPWRVVSATAAPALLNNAVENPMDAVTPLGVVARNTTASNDPPPSSTPVPAPQSPTQRKRARKSKRTRIKLRLKFRAKEQAKLKKQEEARGKEEYIREKKTKVNRAKQHKKREKARLERMANGGAGVDPAGGAEAGD